MTTIPLPVDAATTADDAADYLVPLAILEDRKDRRR